MLKTNEEAPKEGMAEEHENSGTGLGAPATELEEGAPMGAAAMMDTSDTPIKLGGG